MPVRRVSLAEWTLSWRLRNALQPSYTVLGFFSVGTRDKDVRGPMLSAWDHRQRLIESPEIVDQPGSPGCFRTSNTKSLSGSKSARRLSKSSMGAESEHRITLVLKLEVALGICDRTSIDHIPPLTWPKRVPTHSVLR